jgi:TolB-like protein/Flp pilus assembly protein TadD/archaellum biogenesis ATPase FlaH
LTSTGVAALDRLLAGGYPEKSAILIEGSSSNEKDMLGYEFIRSGLDLVESCLYISRLSRSEVIDDARAFGVDLDRGTSWMCSEVGGKGFSADDLAGVSFGIKGALKERHDEKLRVIFDLTSQLLITNSSDSVGRFFTQLLVDLKKSNAVLIATVQEDMHPPQVLASLELLFDGVLRVNRTQDKVEITVKKMRGIRSMESSVLIPIVPKAEAAPKLRAERVAVLPFVNMSSDPNDEFFADGLTEELIDRLCQIRELEVIARTSVMAYKNKEKKAGEIGAELKVGSLVEGSVRKAGNRIRVTAQLIATATESHLWSSRYDSELQDIFAVQGDIAAKITEALKLNLIDAVKERIEKRATSVPEAYVAYLNGIYFRYKASSMGLAKAAEFNKKAIELDPGFAEAYAQYAVDQVFLGVYFAVPVDQAFSKAEEVAAKALKLGPNLSEAHYARSWVAYFYESDWATAEREAKAAIELKPSYAEPRSCLAWILLTLRRNEEAVHEARKAVDLDPMGVYSHLVLAHVLSAVGKFDEATLWHRKTIEIEPDSPFFHSELGFAYLQMGKIAEGVGEMELAARLPDGEFFKSGLGYAYAVSGRREDAQRILSEMESMRSRGMARPYEIAMVYAGLEDRSKALDLLEQAQQERSIIHLIPLSIEPAFAKLRPEPRFEALLKKLNLKV